MRLIVPGEKVTNTQGEEEELPSMVYTGQDKIHELLIERNITHFSKAKTTPQGINGFIYNALGPYGFSNFSDRVLKGEMTEEEKASFDMAEAAELFEAISKPAH